MRLEDDTKVDGTQGEDTLQAITDRLLWQEVDPQPSQAFISLSSRVQEALRAIGIGCRDLGALACSVGPGSFTGMRIGLAYAYGLGQGLKGLLYGGLSSLQCAGEWFALKEKKPSVMILPSTRTHGFWMAADSGGLCLQKPALVDLTGKDGSLGPLLDHISRVGTWGKDGPWGRLVYLGGPENLPFASLLDRVLRERLGMGALVDGLNSPEQQQPPYSVDSGVISHPLVQNLDGKSLGECVLRGMVRWVLASGPGMFSEERPKPLFLRLSTAEETLLKAQTPVGC